jgi:hypothetical protein
LKVWLEGPAGADDIHADGSRDPIAVVTGDAEERFGQRTIEPFAERQPQCLSTAAARSDHTADCSVTVCAV